MESNKSKIFLHNHCYVETDSFGKYTETNVRVGFVNYNYKNIGKEYYSQKEVNEMLDKGELIDDNLYKKDDGNYDIRSSYCSYCGLFDIYCGVLFGNASDDIKHIIEYCKELGILHDNFVPVKGWKGTKTMEKIGGKYNIYYTIDDFDSSKYNADFVRKICLGAVHKLMDAYETMQTSTGTKKERKFNCDRIVFNKELMRLEILGIDLYYVRSNIHSVINKLDLELWILMNGNKDWSNFFSAVIDVVSDCGQRFWLDDVNGKHVSNIMAYDKATKEKF